MQMYKLSHSRSRRSRLAKMYPMFLPLRNSNVLLNPNIVIGAMAIARSLRPIAGDRYFS